MSTRATPITSQVQEYESAEQESDEEGHILGTCVDEDANLHCDNMLFVGMLCVLQAVFFGYAGGTQMGYATADLNPQFYAMFIDVSIMIFFGFGFLMTFLKHHGFSAVGFCTMVSCAVVEFSLVVQNWFEFEDQHFQPGLNLFSLINGLFCAGAVMISMGAVLGKVSPSQLLFMGLAETVLYFGNYSVYTTAIGAVDAAGGVCLHAFGAYFGLVVAKCLTTSENVAHEDNGASYSSDMTSLMGTLFLWLLWPSFCGAVAFDPPQAMFWAVTNTYIGLVGSVVGFAVLSRLLHHGKFDIVEMQNATLAGGVAMGVGATLDMGPVAAFALGLAAGLLSVFGYAKVNLTKIGISDTCGVHNLHGMPGLLGGLFVILYIFIQKPADYDAGLQVLGMLATLGIAIVGGLLTAVVMKTMPGVAGYWNSTTNSMKGYYADFPYWEVEEEHLVGK